MRFSAKDKQLVVQMLERFKSAQEADARFRAVNFARLYTLLSKDEKLFVKKLLALDPRKYGFKGPHFGVGRPPQNLVRIPKTFTRNGEVHFLPPPVLRSFKHLRARLKKETGEELLVDSGYRSPAYQLVVLLFSLADAKFKLSSVARWVAFPGWSEHGTPQRQAIDFTLPYLPENTTADPIFEKTPAYRWLSLHAGEYGFHLSYPRHNKYGVKFEPWHWHFGKNKE